MASKLGWHCYAQQNDAVARVLDESRAVVVKAMYPHMGSPEWWAERKRHNPQCLYIYRHYWPHDFQQQLLGMGQDGGRRAAQDVLQGVAAYRDVFQLVEGLNEPTGDWPAETRAERYRQLDEFQAGFYGVITEAGLIPVAFNIGTGNLDAEIVRQYFPRTLERYAWYGFHEYDWPRLDHEGCVSWRALRYRRVLPALPAQARVLVTECGLTQAAHGGPDIGWQSGVNAAEYLRTLKWYDAELRKDEQVRGACIYMLGAANEWESFELLGEVADGLIQYSKEGTMPEQLRWLKVLMEAGVKDIRHELPTNGGYPWRGFAGVRYSVAHYVGLPVNPGQSGVPWAVATANYHVKSRGWPGIGYHLVIDVLGDIYLVGDLDTSRANVLNKNHLVVGTCLQGGGDGWVPNEKQVAAWRRLQPVLWRALDKGLEIVGHRDLQATLCPGNRYKEWLGLLAPLAPQQYVVGEGIKNYLKAHAELGVPIADAFWDKLGNEYVETDKATIVWSKKRNIIKHITW